MLTNLIIGSASESIVHILNFSASAKKGKRGFVRHCESFSAKLCFLCFSLFSNEEKIKILEDKSVIHFKHFVPSKNQQNLVKCNQRECIFSHFFWSKPVWKATYVRSQSKSDCKTQTCDKEVEAQRTFLCR